MTEDRRDGLVAFITLHEQVVGAVVPIANEKLGLGVVKTEFVEEEDVTRSGKIDCSAVFDMQVFESLLCAAAKSQNGFVTRWPIGVSIECD
ncbi:hypothetical protein AXK11_04980 [Cephaloticoccus primus]|uniref:Uncharacterized protein n=1 Tax=Cephaloticoccus primus TaxID=1548207 RepID=A0A139SMZ3_9BACT|nr:hypothetical protein AXK11_04980 [Cephaloticoccus primus]